MPDLTPKPTITDEHLQKYEEIMKTGTLQSDTPVLPTAQISKPAASTQNSRISSILSSLPKPKGIGGKMFIFNGKKKIIMENGAKEVENVKTVSSKDMKKMQQEEEKAPQEEVVKSPTPTSSQAQGKPTEKKPSSAKSDLASKGQGGKGSLKKLIIGGAVLILIWTAAWAYFLGFFSLLGL